MKKKSRFFLLLTAAVIVTAEIILSFFGPMATLAKTSVIVAPIYNSINKDESYIDQLTRIIESHMVKTGSFTIVRQVRFSDYFDKHPEEVKKYQSYSDYMKIAGEAGIEKLLTVSVYGTEAKGFRMQLALRDTREDLLMKAVYVTFSTLDELDKSKEIIDGFSFTAKRVSLFDMAYILLLVLFTLSIILHALGIKRFSPIELTLVLNLVLFLFSWFFAKNANMDYFQHFVATMGQVTIGRDTTTEQLYTAIRFVPIFLVTLYLYFAERKRRGILRWAMGLTVLSALFYGLSFPNAFNFNGYPFLAWFALVPLFTVLVKSGYRKGLFYGSAFGVIQSIILNFWQGTYSYIGLQLVTIGLLIEYLLFMAVLNLILKMSGKWKLLVLPPVWLLFEYLRSVGYIGYPWGLIGTSQFAFTPFIQLASVTGIWGLSLVLLYFNSALTWVVTGRGSNGKGRIFPAVVLGLTILVVSGGAVRIAVIGRAEEKADKNDIVIVVQQNRDPRKHSFQQSLDFAIEVTNAALGELKSRGEKPSLVLWPEGAFKPDIRFYTEPERSREASGKLATQLVEYVRSIGTWLATGTRDHILLPDGDGRQIQENFNSSALLAPDGSIADIYHKIKLVPFTEHFPYKEQFPKVWEFLQKFDTSNWLAGWDWKVMDAGGLKIFTPICFEDSFPGHIRKFVLAGGQLIANMSNDYWSLSPVEGKQHGINGLFRAVENRRPMVRATCSGYTVYADPLGRIRGEVKEFYAKGYIIARIPRIKRPITLYTRYGDWLPMTALLFTDFYLLFRPVWLLYLRLSERRRP